MNASRRLNILPVLTPANKGDKRFGNAVLHGDGTLGHANYAANCHDVVRIQFRGDAAASVFSGGNWLQVSRIDASAITAKMVKVHALWDLANKLFIDPAVRGQPLSRGLDSPIATGGQRPIPIPASGRKINCVGCVDIGLATPADACDLRLTSYHAAIVSSQQTAWGEAATAAAAWQQHRGFRSELVIPKSGTSAAASVFRLREVSAALNALLGTIGVHDRLQSVVPRRRVFLAPLRLSVLSEQLYQAGGALCP